ncbi:MAG TPA: Holliday junction resolvase RuvX [Vampirovibrionales bacterium]
MEHEEHFQSIGQRIICLDVGRKKVGVAISDKTQKLASPLKTFFSKQFYQELTKVLDTYPDVKTVLLGLPLSADGKENDSTERIRRLGSNIEARFEGISVVYENERLTSWEARELLRDSGYKPAKIAELEDQVAAKLILQSYLNERIKNNQPHKES